jgi:uridine kinase
MSEPIGLGRGEAVTAIAELVEGVSGPHPTRIAIDGPDAAGKTTPADELAEALRERGREVVRASIDGFHRPRSERCRQGPESPLGCYEDSFDYERIRAELLEDAADAVLIFDGVFLLRPELADAWDLRIFVSVGFDEILRRARIRDAELFGSADEAERRYPHPLPPRPAALPRDGASCRARGVRDRERRPLPAPSSPSAVSV